MTAADGDPQHRQVVLRVGTLPEGPGRRWGRRVATAAEAAAVCGALVLGSLGGALAGSALLDAGDGAVRVVPPEVVSDGG